MSLDPHHERRVDGLLEDAVRADDAGAVRRLLDGDASVQWLDPYGARRHTNALTPLHSAAIVGATASGAVLLSYGADPNNRDSNEWSPLFYAVCTGGPAMVALLLAHGADVAVRGIYGRTVLHVAARRSNTPAMRLLLDHGADVAARDDHGLAPLHAVITTAVVLNQSFGADP